MLELLGEIGEVSEEISKKILNTKDMSQLKKWIKLAAKADTVENFLKEM